MTLASTIEHLLEDHRKYHSAFQIDCFIIAQNGVTPWGAYKQALRELESRWTSLKMLYVKRLVLQDGRRLLEEDVKKDPRILYLEREIEADELEKQIKDTEREFRRFLGHAAHLKKMLGELTEEQIEKLEEQEWIGKLRKKAALELVANGHVSEGTLDAILSLPEAAAEETSALIDSIRDRVKAIAWLRKHRAYSLDTRYDKEVSLEAEDALRRIQAG